MSIIILWFVFGVICARIDCKRV